MAAGVDVLAHTTLGNQKLLWEPDLVQEMITHDIAVIPTLKLWRYEMTKDMSREKHHLGGGRYAAAAAGSARRRTGVVRHRLGYMTDYDPTDEYVLMSRPV